MPEMRTVSILARMEFRAAVRDWWLLLYALIFTGLSGGVAYVSGGDLAGLERGEFGRTAAALTNVVLLVVPLFGLIAGSNTVARDRERGLLAYYLAHPISHSELFLGKYLGGAAALFAGLALGFAGTAFALAFDAGIEASAFSWLVGLAVLLLLASFSIGMLISVLAGRSSVAVGLAVFVWVVLLFLGDLGLMATAVATDVDFQLLIGIALLNPAEVFKVASISQIGASLDALGPAGNYLARNLGDGLLPVLLALLAAWIMLPVTLAVAVLRRRDAV